MLLENVRIAGRIAGVVFPIGGGALSSTGEPISPDSYAQTITYNTDGTINYFQFTDGAGAVYRQTMGYTSGKVTSISAWVKQ